MRAIDRVAGILDVLAVPALCVLLGAGEAPMLAICAALHELSHIAVLKICGGRLVRFYQRGFGLQIRYSSAGLPVFSQIAVSAAGPAANLFVAAAAIALGGYRLAAVNAVLAVFNLLPVGGLDGGEILLAGLGAVASPGLAWRITRAVSLAASAALWLFSLYVQLRLAPVPEILIVSSAIFIRELMQESWHMQDRA